MEWTGNRFAACYFIKDPLLMDTLALIGVPLLSAMLVCTAQRMQTKIAGSRL